ncbi:MAG: BON domain-containing protein [bacterium]
MRRVRIRMLPFIALAVVSIAPGNTRAEDPDSRSDVQVTGAVENQYRTDRAVPLDRIDVHTKRGVVTLEGTVRDLLARRRAVRIAETVKGVRSVVDRLDVEQPEKITDSVIRGDVLAALLMDPATDSYEIAVSVSDGGVVTLSGTVQSWRERELAATVAAGVRGVTELHDDLEVSFPSSRPDREIREEIAQTLVWNTRIDATLVAVDVEEGEVQLSGIVGSAAEKREAREEAWTEGVRGVDDAGLLVEPWARDDDQRDSRVAEVSDSEIADALRMALRQDPRVPSENVTIEVRSGEVSLTGDVENLEAKRAAEATARHTVGVISVNDGLKVARDGIAAVNEPAGARETALESEILAALRRDPWVSPFDVRVDVTAGVARLSGRVDTYLARARADEVTARVPGVIDVLNALEVDTRATAFDPYVDSWPPTYPDWYAPEPQAWKSDAQITEDIENQLWWSPFVSDHDVDVVVTDGVATLTGTVNTWVAWDTAQDEAYDAGATLVMNRLQVQ